MSSIDQLFVCKCVESAWPIRGQETVISVMHDQELIMPQSPMINSPPNLSSIWSHWRDEHCLPTSYNLHLDQDKGDGGAAAVCNDIDNLARIQKHP